MTAVRRRAGRQREHDVVEAALHVERRGQRPPLHPEDAEAPVVGDELARADAVDVLRRQRHADDGQRAQPAVDDRADPVAEVRAGGRATKPSLASTSSGAPGSIQRPRRRKRSLTRGRRVGGDRDQAARGRLVEIRARSSVTSATTRVSTAETPGMAAIAAATRAGARLSEAKTSAKRWRS